MYLGTYASCFKEIEAMSLRVRVCMGTAGEQREGRKQCNYILISKPTLEKSKGLLWLTVWRSQSMTGRHHFQS